MDPQFPRRFRRATMCKGIPWADARDSHLAKFAIPRATWESTSGCLHLTIPSNALIPPSVFSFICNLSADKAIYAHFLVISRHYILEDWPAQKESRDSNFEVQFRLLERTLLLG